jgi:hypothetical protein
MHGQNHIKFTLPSFLPVLLLYHFLLVYILITYSNRPPEFHTSIWQPPALTNSRILNAHKLLTSAALPSLLGFQHKKNPLGTGTNPFRFSPCSSRPTHRPRFSSKQLEPREVVQLRRSLTKQNISTQLHRSSAVYPRNPTPLRGLNVPISRSWCPRSKTTSSLSHIMDSNI